MAARNWTEQQKQRQSELIQKWKPWKSSTGAKTPQGKARSSQNALKHGLRSTEALAIHKEASQELKQLKLLLNKMEQATKEQDLEGIPAVFSKLVCFSLKSNTSKNHRKIK